MGLATETPLGEEALLQLVMQAGKPLQAPESLATIQQRTAASVASLPQETRRLDRPVSVNVEISAELQELKIRTAEAQRTQR